MGDLASYLVARRIDLAPEPDWLDQCWEPPEVVMSDRVRAWLDEQGAEPDLERAADLPPLLDVRQQNSQRVLEVAARAAPILAAWVAKQGGGASAPSPWAAKEPTYEVDRDARMAGIKDFEPLDEVQVLAWLAATGRWPDAMHVTLDLTELGLTLDEVEAAGRQPEPDPYRPPELEFGGGETVVAGEAGFSDLMRLVESQLTSDLLGTSDAYASLTEPLDKSKRRGGGGSVTAGRNNVPDELKGSIGLIGEVCALRWLAHRYRLDGDEHWVSGYRNLVLDDEGGNDALGYDFAVERSGDQRPYYFEVKTSTGPATAFEFPDVEVRAAQEHWRKDEYRIILITNALDPPPAASRCCPTRFHERGRPTTESWAEASSTASGSPSRARRLELRAPPSRCRRLGRGGCTGTAPTVTGRAL